MVWNPHLDGPKLAGYAVPGIIQKRLPAESESAKRKGMPLWKACFMYFPDALLAIAEHSRKANDKHNPGEPIHWSKDKSSDHADCIARHLLDIGPNWDAIDPELGTLHATALAWRANALLQTVLERQRAKAQHTSLDRECQARGPAMAAYPDTLTPPGAR
jgi:hypothetical protein